MAGKLYNDPEIGQVMLVKSGRGRRISIRVHPVKGVTVSIPYYLGYEDGMRFFMQKRGWVVDTVLRQRARLDQAERAGTAVGLLCSGSVGVMQKVLGYSDYSQEQNGFLLVAMAVSALFALGSFLYRRYGKGEVPTLKLLSAATPAAAINGVCMVVCNVVNLYLAAVMPSILFFPLFNGGALLLLTAVAFLVFRERLNRVQTVGFLIGVAAVFLLCLG